VVEEAEDIDADALEAVDLVITTLNLTKPNLMKEKNIIKNNMNHPRKMIHIETLPSTTMNTQEEEVEEEEDIEGDTEMTEGDTETIEEETEVATEEKAVVDILEFHLL